MRGGRVRHNRSDTHTDANADTNANANADEEVKEREGGDMGDEKELISRGGDDKVDAAGGHSGG